MTFKAFSTKFNINEYDMLEVLKEGGFFKKDYSDWKPKFYKLKIVSDLDNIKNYKQLKKELTAYRYYLKKFYYSRQTCESDYLRIIIRDRIRSNASLIRFIQGDD